MIRHLIKCIRIIYDRTNKKHLFPRTQSLERLSYDLEKVFTICFTDQCLARLKQSFSSFPPRKLLICVVNSSIGQSHYCISNDVNAKSSTKFHGENTLFASAFAKPMKIRARLFLFGKPIKCFALLFTPCFKVI